MELNNVDLDKSAEAIMRTDGNAQFLGSQASSMAPNMGVPSTMGYNMGNHMTFMDPAQQQQQGLMRGGAQYQGNPNAGGTQRGPTQAQMQQYAAQRGYPPQMMMQHPGAHQQQENSAHYRLTQQRSMNEPDPFLVASTSQGMQQQGYPPPAGNSNSMERRITNIQEVVTGITRMQPLPPPETIEKMLFQYPTLMGPVGGPSFAQVREFYNAAPKYDIAWCSLKIIGAHLQFDPQEKPRIQKILRLADEYNKNLNALKKKKEVDQIKKLQEMTLKVLQKILGADKYEKIQVTYTGYFLKLVLFEMDQSQRQRGSHTHLKCIALFANLGAALKKAPQGMHYKIQSQGFKTLHTMVGHQTLEYLWRRALYIFIYLKDKSTKRKKQEAQQQQQQQQMMQQMGYMPQGQHPYGAQNPMYPANAGQQYQQQVQQMQQQNQQQMQQKLQQQEVSSPRKGQAKGRKRKASVDSPPEPGAQQENNAGAESAAKKPRKGAKGKTKKVAETQAAAKQVAVGNLSTAQGNAANGMNGSAKTQAGDRMESFIADRSATIFTPELKRRVVGEALKLSGFDVEPSAFETLGRGVDLHLRQTLRKALDLVSSRTLPFSSSSQVVLTSEPRKDVAAIFRRELASAKAKENAEKAALLKEGETKRGKKDMDSQTKEKLEKLLQEQDKRKQAQEANAATLSVLGGDAAKWQKWSKPKSGAGTPRKQGQGAQGAPSKEGAAGIGSDREVVKPSLKVDDLVFVLDKDWRYKESKWLMQLRCDL